MARNVKVQFQGSTVDGRAVEFDAKKEAWNEYVTEDGALVRVRTVVSEIIVTSEKTPDGEPVVLIKSATLVTYVPKGG